MHTQIRLRRPMRSSRSRRSSVSSLFAMSLLSFLIVSCGSDPSPSDGPTDAAEDVSQDLGVDSVDAAADATVPDVPDQDVPGDDVPMTDIGPTDTGVIDIIEPECVEGQTREFVCEDGTEVAHCICEDNIFECVDSPESACPPSSFCGDGSELECDQMMPLCETGSTPAIRFGCWECILDELCPENIVFCGANEACAPNEMCVECATSSCPLCTDCVAACLPHGCASEEVILCNALRPDCGAGEVSIARDGCWLCVDQRTCEAPDDPSPGVDCETNNDCGLAEQCGVGPDGRRFCEDTGCISEDSILCFSLLPICEEGQTRISVNGCWACVEIASCMRFGEICFDDQSCPPGGFCGCPEDVDCDSSQCVESECATQAFIGCRALRPDCGPNGVAVAEDGCWACKDRDTCEPIRGK